MLFSVVALLLTTAASAEKFNPLHHGGPSSPYFDAPLRFGIDDYDTPEGCVVDQAAYMLRHGTRYPEPGSYTGWKNLYAKLQNATYTARGPLAFLPSWTPAVEDEPHQPLYLTSLGAQESFELGARLRRRYHSFTPGGKNFTVWSADQQRCLDTATFLVRGYLSQGNYLSSNGTENRGILIELPDEASDANSLTPSSACPAYDDANNGSASANGYRAVYRPKIAKRLNRFLDGDLELNATDIGVMQDLCGFGYGIDEEKRFCNIFTEKEWLEYEYAHDLNYYYGSGPGNALSATNGYPWVKAITDLFEVGPGATVEGGDFIPPPLVVAVTHDNNLPPFLSALGLWNETALDKEHQDDRRSFRSSNIVAFRSMVALERLTCSSPPADSCHHVAGTPTPTLNQTQATQFVRIRVNDAPVPLPSCTSGPGKSCPLDDFIQYIEERGNVVGKYDERCGLEGVKNGVEFLTKTGDGWSAVTLIGENYE